MSFSNASRRNSKPPLPTCCQHRDHAQNLHNVSVMVNVSSISPTLFPIVFAPLFQSNVYIVLNLSWYGSVCERAVFLCCIYSVSFIDNRRTQIRESARKVFKHFLTIEPCIDDVLHEFAKVVIHFKSIVDSLFQIAITT